MKENKWPVVTCRLCHKKKEARYGEPIKTRMVKLKLCFDCLHWHELFERRNESCIVRISHRHYIIGPDTTGLPRAFRGFGGVRCVVVFKDGRKVETSNLWYQGDIPIHFWRKLPDNAKKLTIG